MSDSTSARLWLTCPLCSSSAACLVCYVGMQSYCTVGRSTCVCLSCVLRWCCWREAGCSVVVSGLMSQVLCVKVCEAFFIVNQQPLLRVQEPYYLRYLTCADSLHRRLASFSTIAADGVCVGCWARVCVGCVGTSVGVWECQHAHGAWISALGCAGHCARVAGDCHWEHEFTCLY